MRENQQRIDPSEATRIEALIRSGEGFRLRLRDLDVQKRRQYEPQIPPTEKRREQK